MTTVTNQIIAEIRERILNGEYRPGMRLHEASVAADLEVSRTPIREAFRVLANDDLLVYSPNRGYIVRCVELKDVLDAYDVRGALEGLACRGLAERGLSDEAKAQFLGIAAKRAQVFRSQTWAFEQHHQMYELAIEFHLALLKAYGNPHIEPLMRQIRFIPRLFDSRLEPESEFFQRVHTRERWARAHQEFSDVVEAMVRRESGRAEALIREHNYANREAFRLGIEEEGLLSRVTKAAGAR